MRRRAACDRVSKEDTRDRHLTGAECFMGRWWSAQSAWPVWPRANGRRDSGRSVEKQAARD
jgi:hypothetical protein